MRWIKVYDKFEEWELYGNSKAKSLFIHLLLKAQYTEHVYNKVYVGRGQLLITYERIMEKLEDFRSRSTVKTYLDMLVEVGSIKCQNMGRNGLLISITNYEEYQDGNVNCTKTVHETVQQSVLQTVQNTEFLPNNNIERVERVEYANEFMEFWNTYPPRRRNARDAAYREYVSIRKDGVTHRAIMKVLEDAMCSRDWTTNDGAYIPMAWKWLQSTAPADFKPYERSGTERVTD